MDFSQVKNLNIDNKDVLSIKNSDGQLMWGVSDREEITGPLEFTFDGTDNQNQYQQLLDYTTTAGKWTVEFSIVRTDEQEDTLRWATWNGKAWVKQTFYTGVEQTVNFTNDSDLDRNSLSIIPGASTSINDQWLAILPDYVSGQSGVYMRVSSQHQAQPYKLIITSFKYTAL